MSADDLREQVAAHLASETWGNGDPHPSHAQHHYHGGCAICRGDLRRIADAALAAPALAALVAELDALRAKVERVRALADEWDREDGDCCCGGCGHCTRAERWTPALRAALDGDA